jgi:hypothetical protein
MRLLLESGQGEYEVDVELTERVEPVDGKVHVSGRIQPHEAVVALLRNGVRDVKLGGITLRLAEVDPWGGVLVRGVRA